MAAWKMRRMEGVEKVMLWARLASQQRDEMNCYFFGGENRFQRPDLSGYWTRVFILFFILFLYIYIYPIL